METEVLRSTVLYEDEKHQFILLSHCEESVREGLVQTNQYLIVNEGRGILLDPGSVYSFPNVLASVSLHVDLDKIDVIFLSHQDPDVSSAVPVWLENTPAKVYVSKLWLRFVPHFGSMDMKRIVPVDDKGTYIQLPSGDRLRLIPSHFLHSIGNFTVFDERSGILFSGDIGASALPPDRHYVFVENFEEHLKFMEAFHRRYMVSNKACRLWVGIVKKLRPKMIAPQHGAIFRNDKVEKFLSWLEELECGVDIIEEIYGVKP